MTPKLKVVLLVSFCLNGVLAAAWLAKRPATPFAPARVEEVKLKPTPKRTVAPVVETVVVDREAEFDWMTLESPDYVEYIENLRSVGCPEETVRDIIIADINKLYAAKMASLYPSPADIKFWQVEDRVARNAERERDRKRRELEDEKRGLIKQLLGVDFESEMARWSGRPDEDELRYGFLSPEKQQATKDLRERYRDAERALFSDGGMTPENRAKFMALRAQRESELATLLGPADFEQYQLRNSSTARNMRENLTGFQPSEAEFRQIFHARKTFDDQYAFTRDGGDGQIAADRRMAEQQMEEQLRAVLGPDRFNDYKLSQDERFRDTFDFAQRYNLPKETATTVYQVRVAAEQERQRIQRDAALNGEAKTAALTALAAQTQSALGQTLGQEGLANYLPRSGNWVSQMTRGDDDRRRRDRDRWGR